MVKILLILFHSGGWGMPNPILLFLYSYYCIFVKVEKNALMEKISKNRKIIDWMYPGHLLELNETNWMVRTFIFQEKGGREGGWTDGYGGCL